MRESGVELAIGDSVRIQDHLLTVIDIHEDEITFRLDLVSDEESGPDGSILACGPTDPSNRRPR
jgi:hypothetical protein